MTTRAATRHARALVALVALAVCSGAAVAHGERAQQANTRMRTTNWYDVEITPAEVAVGERVTVRGRFRTSRFWPDHIPSPEDRVFLNVGTSGPTFVRETSHIDGVSMVQSTALELGRDYGFDITLKARRPGRYHVHPVLSVKDAGPLVGPGRWIEVGGSAADFTNTAVTMFGRDIDLETFHLGTIFGWHLLWFAMGGAWLYYWLRHTPILIPRYQAVREAEERHGDADVLVTPRDQQVALGFFMVTLMLIIGGYRWAEERYPVTTPLRSAKITLPAKPVPDATVDVELRAARYQIPGRSFQMALEIRNRGATTLQIGEFETANVRFINAAVHTVTPIDSHDLVAPAGLRVEGGPIAPGETTAVKVFAEDALWETQRLTHMINDPDSVVAGLLFFQGEDGSREIVEVGGPMLPVFD